MFDQPSAHSFSRPNEGFCPGEAYCPESGNDALHACERHPFCWCSQGRWKLVSVSAWARTGQLVSLPHYELRYTPPEVLHAELSGVRLCTSPGCLCPRLALTSVLWCCLAVLDVSLQGSKVMSLRHFVTLATRMLIHALPSCCWHVHLLSSNKICVG